MGFFALLFQTPLYDETDVTIGTTQGSNNHYNTFSITIVTDWFGDIVEWDNQEGDGVDTDHSILDC